MKKGAGFNFTSFFQDIIAQNYTIAEEETLLPGNYRRQGEIVEIFPINGENPLRVVVDFDRIENIYVLSENTDSEKEYFQSLEIVEELNEIDIYPNILSENVNIAKFLKQIGTVDLLVYDEIDFSLEEDLFIDEEVDKIKILPYANIGESDERLKYSDVLYFYSLKELEYELKEKMKQGFQIFILTQKKASVQKILEEKNFSWVSGSDISLAKKKSNGVVKVIESSNSLEKVA